jgi:hypothetical protein
MISEKRVKIIICLLIIPVNALAGTYWIDSRANSRGTGSIQSPYNSFKAAIDTRGGGHTFIFKPGIYSAGQITVYPQHRGTPQSPTVLKSKEKYKAVLHGSVSHGIFIGSSP